MAATSTEIRKARGEDGRTRAADDVLRQAAQLGYALAALSVFVGWLLTRRTHLVDPLNGVGYWLGIVGASLMAVLLLYPVRKKFRFMRFFGETRHWFRVHMVFGVLGPILILYHSNFELGSLNSNVALYCTLLVAVSGLIGRYIHARVHTDLDGSRTTLRELADKARMTAEQQARVTALVPGLLERITAFDAVVLQPSHGLAGALLLPPKLALLTRLEGLRLAALVRRQLRIQAQKSAAVAAQRKRLQTGMTRFTREHLRRVRKVAELNSYERMFGLWHLFHLPLFYMLVVTALVHVVAVHMY